MIAIISVRCPDCKMYTHIGPAQTFPCACGRWFFARLASNPDCVEISRGDTPAPQLHPLSMKVAWLEQKAARLDQRLRDLEEAPREPSVSWAQRLTELEGQVRVLEVDRYNDQFVAWMQQTHPDIWARWLAGPKS